MSKRAYNSSRRKAQARQTRRQIVEAARTLFSAFGYSGATVEAIAQEAGVAVETVYASFGNKRNILSRLIDVSLVGDDEPTPFLQRQGPLAVQQEKDQNQQIQLFAGQMVEIMGRVAPLFEVMRAAAKSEPDIAEMLQRILDERVEGLKFFAAALLSNGPLQDELSLDDASEIIWAISSGEVYTLLVVDRGWPVEKYKQWLANTLIKLILP
ncbi:MAG: TetR/AcrR family transcriptional regulator [Anaerolineales bacterium]|nr:TetR/AcrR family transcriptional regulator [Anaerolineales bacterium]